MLLFIFTFLTSLITFFYLWLKRKHSFWQRHGMPFIYPAPIVGSLKDLLLMRISFGEFFQNIHQEASHYNLPAIGFYAFHTPALLLRDPELIKEVFIKKSNLFCNRYEAADPHDDPHGSLTLPLAKYDLWRSPRKKLSHLFTKRILQETMLDKILKEVQNLEDFIGKKVETSGGSEAIIEVKEMCNFYTIDVTASIFYSLDAKSLKQEGSLLSQQAEELFKPTLGKAFQFMIVFFLPQFTRFFKAKVFPMSFIKFMENLFRKSLERKREYLIKPSTDLIEMLLEFQQETSDPLLSSEEFMVSQISIFLLAGYETSSSLLAFILYELAKQPLLQERLFEEIHQKLTKTGKVQLSFLDVKQMVYLNMVLAEALRLYPTASFINREFVPKLKTETFSLKPFFDFEVPHGMPIYVSILGLHHDEKFWKNPELFDPQRFIEEKLPDLESLAYIPFGCGPHACIGSRLGILQVKLALIYVLRSYKVCLCPDTPKKIYFNPSSFMLSPKGDLNLKFNPRT